VRSLRYSINVSRRSSNWRCEGQKKQNLQTIRCPVQLCGAGRSWIRILGEYERKAWFQSLAPGDRPSDWGDLTLFTGWAVLLWTVRLPLSGFRQGHEPARQKKTPSCSQHVGVVSPQHPPSSPQQIQSAGQQVEFPPLPQHISPSMGQQ